MFLIINNIKYYKFKKKYLTKYVFFMRYGSNHFDWMLCQVELVFTPKESCYLFQKLSILI